MMDASILSLGTVVPEFSESQRAYAHVLGEALELNEKWRQKLEGLSANSRIERRYTSLPYFESSQQTKMLLRMNTQERNVLYKEIAPKLSHLAAVKALEEWGESKDAITHVVFVSCTGMMAPGIEFSLVDSLSLKRSVQRFGLNFMGCFGAFRALAVAKAFALEDPSHRVLIVCTELCSLHLQPRVTLSNLVGNILFSDGAAAAVVGCEKEGQGLWKIDTHRCLALENSIKAMTWEQGNNGYIMHLANSVPKKIQSKITGFAQELAGDAIETCDWPIHPGGKAILEGIDTVCNLPEGALDSSWEVLQNYGNMSSSTFLFVLDALRRQKIQKKRAVGLGFGPGLSIEGVRLERCAVKN